MNITEHALRAHKKGVDLSIRTGRICPWACVAITLQDHDGFGISLLFSKTELENVNFDIVGMRIDHAIQDHF
jgi:hypothetical protein